MTVHVRVALLHVVQRLQCVCVCSQLPAAMVLLSKDQLDAQKEKGKGARAVTNSVLKDKENTPNVVENVAAKVQAESWRIQKEFYAVSHGVTADYFALGNFPIDDEGHWSFGGSGCRRNLTQEIERFLHRDAECNKGMASEAWHPILAAAFPELKEWRLADMLLGLCLRAWKHRKAGYSYLDMVEFFAGSGNLTKEFMRRKKNCVALDKLYGEHHDVLYPQKIRLWVDALSNTVCDSLNWFGTRCSSFVMLCAAQAKRKEENQFWGDTSRLFIVEGNHLCNVTSLLFFISYLLMNVPCLEQPADSLLAKVSTMQLVLGFTKVCSARTYGAAFGGETRKPWMIWSTSRHVASLERAQPDAFACGAALVTRNPETGSFTGIKDALHVSEWYPPAFGAAVANMMAQHQFNKLM